MDSKGSYGKMSDGIGRYSVADGSTRWRVVFRYDGKTRSRGGFKTKGAAQHWQRHTLVSIDKGDHVTPDKGRLTFGTFAEGWLATAKLRPSTQTVYGYMLKGDLASWRDVPLAKITPAKVRRWRHDLENRPAANSKGTLSSASVQKQYRLLKRILGVAVEDGHQILRLPLPSQHDPPAVPTGRVPTEVPTMLRVGTSGSLDGSLSQADPPSPPPEQSCLPQPHGKSALPLPRRRAHADRPRHSHRPQHPIREASPGPDPMSPRRAVGGLAGVDGTRPTVEIPCSKRSL